MSNESSGRPRVRRRTNTAPEGILGDLQRERWRVEMAQLTRRYRIPRSGFAAALEPDAVVMELEGSSMLLAPGLAARILAMGPRITTHLLDFVERSAGEGHRMPHWPSQHALRMLGDIRDLATVPRLLALLGVPMDRMFTSKITVALRCFGHALVDPAIAAYRAAEDANHRALVLEVLTASRVTDPRIRELCCEWLEGEPAFGADMLIDYGDPAAVESLRNRLARMPEVTPHEHVVALCNAIEVLAGKLSPAEYSRAERAREALWGKRRG